MPATTVAYILHDRKNLGSHQNSNLTYLTKGVSIERNTVHVTNGCPLAIVDSFAVRSEGAGFEILKFFVKKISEERVRELDGVSLLCFNQLAFCNEKTNYSRRV